MAYTPVVSPEENLVVVKCSTCRGAVMVCVERYASASEKDEIRQYEERQYLVSRVPVRRANAHEECLCRHQPVIATPVSPPPAPTPRTSSKPTGRPVLSLSVKRRV